MYKKIRITTESPFHIIVPDNDILPNLFYLFKKQNHYCKLLIIMGTEVSNISFC